MSSFEELDSLSSADLHHRATALARDRRDVRFLWRLIESIPEARSIASGPRAGESEVQHPFGWLYDFVTGGGQLDDALRPLYIDYIREHEEPPKS